MPQTPFLKAASNPKVGEACECAEKIYEVYGRWFLGFTALFAKHVSDISWKNEPALKVKVVHHLCDRILYVPIHAAALHKENPMFSFIDCASLNRSMFESIINCLYILTDKSNGALAGMISNSVDEDVKLRNELLKWISHPDPAISQGAKMQVGLTQKLLSGVHSNPPAFPKIRQRCEKLSDVWQFLYVSRYKQMCAWSHIHMESVFNSPSHTMSSFEDLADAVGKGTEMVYLSFHLLYHFLLSLTEGNQGAQEELNTAYQNLLTELNPILCESGNLTPTSE